MARVQIPRSPVSLFLMRAARQVMTIPHSPLSWSGGAPAPLVLPRLPRSFSRGLAPPLNSLVQLVLELLHGDPVLDRVLIVGAGLERRQQVAGLVLRLGERRVAASGADTEQEGAIEREAVPGCRGQAARGVERLVDRHVGHAARAAAEDARRREGVVAG